MHGRSRYRVCMSMTHDIYFKMTQNLPLYGYDYDQYRVNKVKVIRLVAYI